MNIGDDVGPSLVATAVDIYSCRYSRLHLRQSQMIETLDVDKVVEETTKKS